jgi:hypothetical protein
MKRADRGGPQPMKAVAAARAFAGAAIAHQTSHLRNPTYESCRPPASKRGKDPARLSASRRDCR